MSAEHTQRTLPPLDRSERVAAALLGTALGDAVGLPWETLSAKWTGRLEVAPTLGAISDDTEHAALTLLALAESQGDEAAFRVALARHLKRWLCTFPYGIGFATLRALIRLWLGVGPESSGSNSAGNGPAMRAAVIGGWARKVDTAVRLARVSATITHADPIAGDGAAIVAAAAHLRMVDPVVLSRYATTEPMKAALAEVAKPHTLAELQKALGCPNGTSGYIVHTVAVALHCCRHAGNDVELAIQLAVRAGGDTDTVAAVTAGIIGASFGESIFDFEWIDHLRGWPWTVARLRAAADYAVGGPPCRPPFAILLAARNIVWFVIFVHWALMRRLVLLWRKLD